LSQLTTYSPSYKPFRYPELVNKAIEHDEIHWGEWEVDLQDDVRQWNNGTLSGEEKNHIKQIFRLFTQSDQIVGGSYVDVFLPHIKNNEARMMMLSFAHRETIHQRAYALLNDTLGFPEEEYTAFLEVEEMAEKAEFMEINSLTISNPSTLAKAVAQTVCNEGMSLFSAFVMLLNYQRPEAGSKMLGMCKVVEWSIRDETLHVQGMTEIFRLLCQENPHIVGDKFKQDIYEMFRRAVELEDKIIDIAYELGDTPSLRKEEVKQYIRYIADRRLVGLGLKPNWDIEKNPLPWVDHIVSGDNQTNFFEQRVSDYNANGMEGDWGWD